MTISKYLWLRHKSGFYNSEDASKALDPLKSYFTSASVEFELEEIGLVTPPLRLQLDKKTAKIEHPQGKPYEEFANKLWPYTRTALRINPSSGFEGTMPRPLTPRQVAKFASDAYEIFKEDLTTAGVNVELVYEHIPEDTWRATKVMIPPGITNLTQGWGP